MATVYHTNVRHPVTSASSTPEEYTTRRETSSVGEPADHRDDTLSHCTLSPDYANCDAHDTEVLRVRGISPEIAQARGYRSWSADDARAHGLSWDHARDTLAVPNYSPAVEFDDYLLRPHEAPIDPETGKPRKYLWRPGHSPALGGPPAGTPEAAARAHRLREDINVPVIVTESVLKGDSVLSHAATDVYTLSIHGTWNWTRNGAPRPELRDIEWRVRKQDRLVHRRLTVLVPDSDYATKPEVAFAWWEFGRSLKRRNADVRLSVTPPSGDGSKQGPDDALARGIVTVADLLEHAVPLPDTMPEICRAETCDTDDQKDRRIATLEADNAQLRRHVTLVTEFAISPLYTPNEKVTILRGGALALADGVCERREDGTVEIGPGKLSNDFRPTDKQHPDYEAFKRSPVNPAGDHWLMRRSSVSTTAKSLERKIGHIIPIRTEMDYRRNPGDPTPHRETVIVMEPPTSMVDFLAAVVSYRPDSTPQRPYRTQEECPHCGEVHARTVTRQTVCGTVDDPGCGTIIRETVVTLPVPLASRPVDDLTDDQRDRLYATTAPAVNTNNLFTETPGLAPPPTIKCLDNFFLRDDHAENAGEVIDEEPSEIVDIFAESETVEPSWLWDIPEDLCACGQPLPPGRKWTCGRDCPVGRSEKVFA